MRQHTAQDPPPHTHMHTCSRNLPPLPLQLDLTTEHMPPSLPVTQQLQQSPQAVQQRQREVPVVPKVLQNRPQTVLQQVLRELCTDLVAC